MTWIDDAILGGDLNELIRGIDRLCAARDWDDLESLRDRARLAHERGHQLWPAAAHAEYRLALEAPGEYAARAVEADNGLFGLGPLAEVAASTHEWSELHPHLEPGPIFTTVANERVVRGERLEQDEAIDAEVFGLPLQLSGWEPPYELPVYRADKVTVDDVRTPLPTGDLRSAGAIPAVEADGASRALEELAGHWTGYSRATVSAGPAESAIGALGIPEFRSIEITAQDGFALMASAAAGGGIAGRRRGFARGRSAAWWAASELAGLEEWPIDERDLGVAISELRWFRWDTGPGLGLSLRIAIEDPIDGLSWALDAHDPPPPETDPNQLPD